MARQYGIGGLFSVFINESRGDSESVGGAYLTETSSAATISAVASQPIADFTQAAVATVDLVGSASQTVPDFIQVFTGTTPLGVSAIAAQTVDAFTNSATLEFVVTSDTPQGLEDFAQAATGSIVVDAAAVQTIPDFTQVFTGFPVTPLDIVASQTVPSFTNAAIGTILVKAASTKAIPAFTQVATAHPVQPTSVSATQTFDAFTQSATLHRGDQTPGLVFRGAIGNVSINRRGLATFEARSSLTLGRGFISERFGPTCRADLYDGRCKVSADAFKATAMVDTVSGQFAFTVTASPDARAVDGWYDMGQGVIESGDNAGSPFAIKTWTASSLTVETMEPVDILVSAGDTLTLYPGCDKSSAMCINRFANIINYRGEEFAAGRDLQLTQSG
jgi:hypothetical protein